MKLYKQKMFKEKIYKERKKNNKYMYINLDAEFKQHQETNEEKPELTDQLK